MLIDILWKIAALPAKTQAALRRYLEGIDDPARLMVVDTGRGRLSLEAAPASCAAIGRRRNNHGGRRARS